MIDPCSSRVHVPGATFVFRFELDVPPELS
jgi:hypothetical protein